MKKSSLTKSLFCASLLFSSSFAFAAVNAERMSHTSEFMISQHFSPGEEVYFQCDSAENKIETQLEDMGAMNVSVRCSGGIDANMPPSTWGPIWITASYQTLHPAATGTTNTESAEWTAVKIHSFDNCYLMSEVFENVKGNFTMQDVSATSRCMNAGSSYRLQMTTLVPAVH